MVKKTIIAVGLVVLLAAIFVGASHKWGYTRYGTVYYYGHDYAPGVSYPAGTYNPPYSYSQYYIYPYGSYNYPPGSYHTWPYGGYYGAYYPEYSRPYGGQPVVSYPSFGTPRLPRGKEGQSCGIIDSQAYGCELGLECDYTKTGVAGVGLCSRQPPVTTYPYQVGPSTVYPYYYT